MSRPYLTEDLACLFQQQLVERDTIEDLRGKLKDAHLRYFNLALQIQRLVTESSASPVGCGDSSPPAVRHDRAGGGFKLIAHTERGKELLRRLPHTGDTL